MSETVRMAVSIDSAERFEELEQESGFNDGGSLEMVSISRGKETPVLISFNAVDADGIALRVHTITSLYVLLQACNAMIAGVNQRDALNARKDLN